ncbi:cysteine desulfurase family protein [Nitrospirillum sp. BR 11828]|uniref:cysteine desulfurase family protein n=1 Tax=Nitrospirillum sp. BR 11828 TaxID=3104325 RepID=UPI002ACAFD0D|nr:cysteine desulfurase family protein [Nitrospirillum sp. BR 11828]MDZ5649032.1 cysteine desulfurase family protein [Nitrospirillum sp. BR 11828]
MPSIYLDHNGTCPPRPEAVAAMVAVLSLPGNPSSVHAQGREARRRVEVARRQVADLVGLPPATLIFTGSGTEANALALTSAGGRRVITSAIEHASVLEATPGAIRCPVTADGVVDVAALDALLAGGPALLSLMAVNNETGVIQPVAEVAALARRHGALFHCDASQAVGRLSWDWAAIAPDYLTISAHKIGGPQGVGALVVRDGVPLTPLLRGGGQERRRRAGTENVAGIVGFGAAAAVCDVSAFDRLASLRDGLEARLRAAAPGLRVAGAGADRVANTSCLVTPGWRGETQVMALDLAGFAVSSGSACSSGKVAASHVLAAMGLAPDLAGSAIRVSLGWSTTAEEVTRFADAWIGLHARRVPSPVAQQADLSPQDRQSVVSQTTQQQ